MKISSVYTKRIKKATYYKNVTFFRLKLAEEVLQRFNKVFLVL